MKVLKNRLVIGTLSIVIALVLAFVAAPMFNTVVSEQSIVVRASKDIKQGDNITADMVERVKVGAFNLPDTVLHESSDIEGFYATAPIFQGDYFTTAKLSAEMPRLNPYLYELPIGKQAISIAIDSFAAGLSGKIEAGDIVSIFAPSTNNGTTGLDFGLVQFVKVLAVTMDDGEDNTINRKTEFAADGSEEAYSPATVTLQVSPRQAAVLTMLTKSHLVLVYRGADGSQFLSAQELYESQTASVTSLATNSSMEVPIYE